MYVSLFVFYYTYRLSNTKCIVFSANSTSGVDIEPAMKRNVPSVT